MTATITLLDLGRRDYLETLELQRHLRLLRLNGTVEHDILILVEHEPTYTLGRGTVASSLPVPISSLEASGAAVVKIERGGDVTWHGPGQLVGYPILDLRGHREDLHWYLRTLEAALIDALARVGIVAARATGRTGVWVEERKIASIGVHVKQWVTLHGFALNVHPDLEWFSRIVPCGLTGVQMTSIAVERGGAPAGWWMPSHSAVTSAFGVAFQRDIVAADASLHALAHRPDSGHPSRHVAHT